MINPPFDTQRRAFFDIFPFHLCPLKLDMCDACNPAKAEEMQPAPREDTSHLSGVV